jgi:putative ABC transport system permease protein
MLQNYFKTALRSLLKNKSFTLINVSGLALGITCVFLILQYLKKETGFDTFHNQAESIYRITWENDNPQTRTPHPMAQAMVHDFPEVENAVSLTPLWGPGLTRETFSIRNPEKNVQYDETGILAVDTTFFKVFTFPLVKGNVDKVLKKMGGILISEKAASKYFGDTDPIGKYLSINDDKVLIEVVGVFRDVPELSHFHFDFLVSYVLEKALEDPNSKFFTWSDFGHYNYVKLKPGTDAKNLEGKLMDWLKKYVDWSADDFNRLAENKYGLRLQPITDIHLKSNLRWELEANGNIEYVYMMIAAALLILVIGCINFINLSTAQSAERAKEIGIRKTLGAFRRQLIFQFTGESVLVSLFAMFISIILIELSLPFFKILTNTDPDFQLTSVLAILLAIGLLVGIAAGIYPSLYLSAVKPTAVLKGKFLQSPKGSTIRKGFTVFQFTASMVLLCASAIIFQQLNSVKHRSLGFDKEEVIILPIKNQDALEGHAQELQNEITKIPGVVSVSAASNIPGRSFNQHSLFASANPQNPIDASEVYVSYDFLKVLNVPLTAGRDFLKENPADLDNAFLLNETAARNLNLENAIGQEITWKHDRRDIKGNLVGIVKDFNFQSLHLPVKPLLFKLQNDNFNYVLVKVNTADFNSTIGKIESTWKKFDNRFGFEFFFLSNTVDQQYVAEEKMAQVLVAFSVIAILIACFGLLGIAALTFRNKTKEISVRKVLGARHSNIIFLLLKDFTVLILLAIIIATPITVWIMGDWLQNFSYRIEMSPLIFAGSGLLLILIAWITLGYLTFRVAQVNPATTLKSE